MTIRSVVRAAGEGPHRACSRIAALRPVIMALLAILALPTLSAQGEPTRVPASIGATGLGAQPSGSIPESVVPMSAETPTAEAADRRAMTEALRPSFDTAVPLRTSGPAPVIAGPAAPALTLPGGWPAIEIRTVLVGMHLLGFSFGLGGATMLDFWVLRWIKWGYLPDNVVRTFEFVGKAVSVGLVLLWLSGLGFLLLYGLYDPAKLTNPKILAKLIIVGVLSINGILVHRLVLPYVAQACRMPLFDGVRRRRRFLFIASGALSGVSWYSAFALGLLHEFNGRVPALTLLGIWLALAMLSAALMEVLLAVKPAIPPLRSPTGDVAG